MMSPGISVTVLTFTLNRREGGEETLLKIAPHFNPPSSNFVLIGRKINLNLFGDKIEKFSN